jgi:hypothetical protein
MGTTLNRKRRRSATATALSLVRKSRIPCIIHDALLSPGCTRALSKKSEKGECVLTCTCMQKLCGK